MDYANVQSRPKVVEVSTYDGSISDSFASLPTVGNLVVVVGGGGSEAVTWAVSDNQGNTYTVQQSSTIGNHHCFVAWTVVATSGGTFTVTATQGGEKDTSLQISEWSGNATSSVMDIAVSGSPSSSLTPYVLSTGSSTAGAGELIVTSFNCDASITLTAAPSGYTSLLEVNGTLNSGYAKTTAAAYKIAGSAGVETATWPDYSASGVIGVIVAFKAAGGGGATVSTITGTTATEASAIVFTTTMSGTGGGTFAYSWSGTATSADYTATLTTGMCAVTGGSGSVTVSGSNITVDSTVTAFTVTVPTTTDALDEANETIRLVIGGVTASSGTINDDDAAPTITGTTSQTVTAGSPVVITYSPGLSGQSRTYTLALTDGTAVGGTDYDNTTVTGDFAVTAGTGSVSISGSTVTVDPGVTEFTLSIGTTA